MVRTVFTVLMVSVLILGCASKKESESEGKVEGVMELPVTSSAFGEGEMIPAKYTADGANVSPPLAWNSIPEGTKSIALICDDPDAPMGTWIHWVMYNLPGDLTGLPENVPSGENPPTGGKHGITDFGTYGYGGPAPPSGTHRYFFKIYALDTVLNLNEGITKAQLEQAMQNHILDKAELIGLYKRG